MDAVGAARRDEVGPIVDQKECPVAIGRGAKGGGGCEQALLVGVLVAKLDQVGAAAQRLIEQASERGRVGAGLGQTK